jgi:molybdopterin converting factor small subunit
MKITVTLFGRYKDIAGKNTIEFYITGDTIIRDIIDAFVKEYPIIKKDKNRIMVIKNKMHTPHNVSINESDDIAFSPPVVSGG